jgi:hypothetical protein
VPADRLTLNQVSVALGDGAVFALHPHDPKDTCPVGHGIRPILTSIYVDIKKAIAARLERHTVSDVLESILRDHPLPTP